MPQKAGKVFKNANTFSSGTGPFDVSINILPGQADQLSAYLKKLDKPVESEFIYYLSLRRLSQQNSLFIGTFVYFPPQCTAADA